MGNQVIGSADGFGSQVPGVGPQPAAYVRAELVDEALACLARYSGAAQVMAGGTDLMPDMRRKQRQPLCLVDISRISELSSVDVADRCVTVGAAVTYDTLQRDLFLQEHVVAVTDAARSVGAWAIQSMATWVGNIVQAMPAADGAIVAIALDAELRVADSEGCRWLSVESTFAGPGVSTIDSSRQLVTHIRFTLPDSRFGTGWQRIGRRDSLELPILNCAAKVCLSEDNMVQEAAIALGPVAPRPYRAREAELFLAGKELTEDVLQQAGVIVQHESSPRSSAARASREYRLRVIPSLVATTLAKAAANASLHPND